MYVFISSFFFLLTAHAQVKEINVVNSVLEFTSDFLFLYIINTVSQSFKGKRHLFLKIICENECRPLQYYNIYTMQCNGLYPPTPGFD